MVTHARASGSNTCADNSQPVQLQLDATECHKCSKRLILEIQILWGMPPDSQRLRSRVCRNYLSARQPPIPAKILHIPGLCIANLWVNTSGEQQAWVNTSHLVNRLNNSQKREAIMIMMNVNTKKQTNKSSDQLACKCMQF